MASLCHLLIHCSQGHFTTSLNPHISRRLLLLHRHFHSPVVLNMHIGHTNCYLCQATPTWNLFPSSSVSVLRLSSFRKLSHVLHIHRRVMYNPCQARIVTNNLLAHGVRLSSVMFMMTISQMVHAGFCCIISSFVTNDHNGLLGCSPEKTENRDWRFNCDPLFSERDQL